jgi:hypothetical protein
MMGTTSGFKSNHGIRASLWLGAIAAFGLSYIIEDQILQPN